MRHLKLPEYIRTVIPQMDLGDSFSLLSEDGHMDSYHLIYVRTRCIGAHTIRRLTFKCRRSFETYHCNVWNEVDCFHMRGVA